MDLANFAAGAVVTGYSFPVVALYHNNGGTVSYSDGMDLARGVSVDPDIEVSGDDNRFYANNRTAESAQQRFRSGTCPFVVDGLLRAAENLIMGISSASTVSVDGESVAINEYDDDQRIPYVGAGYVVRCQSNGEEFFLAWVYPKGRFAQFVVPAATEEEEIDWQTTTLDLTLMRDDSSKHRWQRISDPLESELLAYNTVRAMLNMEPVEELPVTNDSQGSEDEGGDEEPPAEET